ncbi:MAG: zinc-dependent metalloprotease, partial [Acidobacteria bacterium]|nr:zinc-dependent metalloprotease [Acidobacteriota bacterium]
MSGKKILFLVLFIVGILFLSIVLGTGYFLFRGRDVTIEENTILEVALTGSVFELPPENPLTQMFGPSTLSLWELGKVLRYAAQDDRVSGLYLEIHPLLLSWAQIEELRDSLHSFRTSGKPIHAFLALDIVRDPELYLACAADSITLNPSATLLVNGLLAEITFYKGTMEKLGIKPEFIQFKEYKSAETFTRETMTPEIREMYESILGDIEERFISVVAQERNLDEERMRGILEAARRRGLYYITDADARPAGAAHPLANLWENGDDMLAALDREMRVRQAALARFGEATIREGRPLATLEEALVPLYLRHLYQVEATVKLIGGVEYSYATRGDALSLPRSIPAEVQRAGLAALMMVIRPEALRLPENIRTQIPPRPPGYGQHRELFPGHTGLTFDPYAPAEVVAGLVFGLVIHPPRAARTVY